MNNTEIRSFKFMIPESLRLIYRYLRARILSIGLDPAARHTISSEEKIASASISVIIPIHDAPDVTERCLLSLERNGGDAEVIIIDDGSKLQRTRKIIDRFVTRNNWSLYRHKKALGHSRACERGAGIAQRTFLCFLNSDTVVVPFSWAGMIRVLNNDSSVGVVGPSTSNTSTSQTVRRAELCCLYWTDRQIDDFAFRYTSQYWENSRVEMDYVGGFAFIVTRRAWKASGGFDTELTGYGNEVDLCRRLRKQGFRIMWTRESYIHHFGESSFKQYFTSEELRNQRRQATRFINSQ